MNDYMLCFVGKGGHPTWEIVSGGDAMQIRVCELVERLGCEAHAIIVLPMSAEIK